MFPPAFGRPIWLILSLETWLILSSGQFVSKQANKQSNKQVETDLYKFYLSYGVYYGIYNQGHLNMVQI